MVMVPVVMVVAVLVAMVVVITIAGLRSGVTEHTSTLARKRKRKG